MLETVTERYSKSFLQEIGQERRNVDGFIYTAKCVKLFPCNVHRAFLSYSKNLYYVLV